MTIFIFWILLIRKNSGIQGLIFREDQFDDLTKDCLKSDGKPLRYILNEDNPAMYVSVDSTHDLKKLKRARESRILKKIKGSEHLDDRQLIREIAEGRRHWLSDLNLIKDFTANNRKIEIDLSEEGGILDKDLRNQTYFDCKLHFETELPRGDKTGEQYDALSLFVVEYHPSRAANVGLIKMPKVEITTLGKYRVRQQYWPPHLKNFHPAKMT